jgi:hypothetical protein
MGEHFIVKKTTVSSPPADFDFEQLARIYGKRGKKTLMKGYLHFVT